MTPAEWLDEEAARDTVIVMRREVGNGLAYLSAAYRRAHSRPMFQVLSDSRPDPTWVFTPCPTCHNFAYSAKCDTHPDTGTKGIGIDDTRPVA